MDQSMHRLLPQEPLQDGKSLDEEQHLHSTSDDEEQQQQQIHQIRHNQRQKFQVWKSSPTVGYIVLFVWSIYLLWLSTKSFRNLDVPTIPTLYSTMDSAIQYETRAFNQGLFGERTIYMGTPNNESEKAWHDITQYGIIKLDESQVSKLPQSTARWRGHDGFYVGGVEMFHQLHCLDKLRKAIWAEHPQTFYGRDNQKDEEADHIDHCIDFLRQTLMCHGSTDIITFRFDEKHKKYQPNFNNVHVCRKYEPLRDWTAAHRAGKNTPDGVEEEKEEEE